MVSILTKQSMNNDEKDEWVGLEKVCDWLIGGFLFGTEIGEGQLKNHPVKASPPWQKIAFDINPTLQLVISKDFPSKLTTSQNHSPRPINQYGSLSARLREDIKTKNTLQFGHCPNYPNPPPHPPIRATLPTLSGRQKRRFARMAGKKY